MSKKTPLRNINERKLKNKCMKTDLFYMRMIETACQVLSDLTIFNHHISQFNIMSMKRRR